MRLILATLVLVGAACTGEPEPASPDGSAPPPATQAPGGGDDGGEPTSPPSPDPDEQGGGGDADRDEPGDDGNRDEPDDQAFDGARGSVGAFARTLLGAGPADAIVVEVLAADGARPDGQALSHLAAVLARESGKPVEVDGPRALDAGDGPHSGDDIRALADRAGRLEQGGGGRAVLRLLYLRGGLAGNEDSLGVAVRGDVAAVFPERIEAAESLLVGAARIERAVAVHELGHLLGLVDLVLDTGREDPEHPGHSRNRGSVMFHAIESSEITVVLDGPPPDDLDDADRADLATLRAGG